MSGQFQKLFKQQLLQLAIYAYKRLETTKLFLIENNAKRKFQLCGKCYILNQIPTHID